MSVSRSSAGLSAGTALLLAAACGLAVANVYYAQPLLGLLAEQFGVPIAAVGSIVTVVQVFYALGLLLIVPLGDLLSRRRLTVILLLLITAGLLAAAWSSSFFMLLAGLALVGLTAVVTQILVNFASALAAEEQRGRIVGIVTSGVVIGILLARTFAGVISDLAGWRAVYVASSLLTAAAALALSALLPADDADKSSLSYGRLLLSVLRLFREERLLRTRAALAFCVFTAFGILWTPLALPLGEAPFFLSPSAIGAFGLAGAAGALGAVGAGRLADRGLGERTTGVALILLLLSWLPIGLLHHSLALLVLGILLLDFAVQAVHVTNQSLLYAALPEARGRLTGAYMTFYSIGSALGALMSTRAYAAYGWTGVSLLGACVSLAGLAFWICTQTRRR